MAVIILVNSLEPAHVIVSVGHEMDIYQALDGSWTAAIATTDRGDQKELEKYIFKTCSTIVGYTKLTKAKISNGNDCLSVIVATTQSLYMFIC